MKPELSGSSIQHFLKRWCVVVVEVISDQQWPSANFTDRLQPVGTVAVATVATFEMGKERVQVSFPKQLA